MTDVSPGNAGGVFAGLVALGGGIKWLLAALWRRLDKRSAELDVREARLDAEEGARVSLLVDRLGAVENSLKSMAEELGTHRLALHILVAKVARDDPKAPELKQVAEILGSAFPVHLHVPADMVEKLNELGDVV